ncbi:Gfo/Idh/MocA family protein [Paenibacillus allorhizosphaerae]|uniref:Inositol 2-dehydrogenase/D-chiro-inositol 3-dehydrogenase n=1 Tax=Paenibacillus allorhizosphaerae TaxID=2849866 RepID=A0ABM8VAF1_9BACL|nr:Gfo/Idh/MocA family oxidoreductase [Paenibacillus allorhizosphaerae]CAG7616168.1 Inositol 2-dehydrogenase/D-chiro-inositol 3-dehydrogenase [Paenibacillus allorhizosphaerae]
MAKLKIGFVGVGGMGQMAHLSNYAVLRDECEVVALAEPRPQLAEQVARRYGVPQVFANHLELIERADVDAIVAAQQYRNHHAIIPDILRAGIPVFTEKPLSLTVETGEHIVKLGEENHTLHMVGYHKRSDPAMEYAGKLAEEWRSSGEFGKLRYIRVTMPPGGWKGGADEPLTSNEPFPSIPMEPGPADFTENQVKQLDAFVNYYIHQVNAIRFFLQESYQLTFGDRSGVLMAGESDSGVTVVLEMAPYRTSFEWHETIQVCFERGFIRIDLPAPLARQVAGKVTVMRDNGKGQPSYVHPVMPNMSAMKKQAMNFIAAVQGTRPAPCAAKEALEDLKLAENYIRYMSHHYD